MQEVKKQLPSDLDKSKSKLKERKLIKKHFLKAEKKRLGRKLSEKELKDFFNSIVI